MTYLYELLSLGQWNFTPFTMGLFLLAAFIVGLGRAGLPGAAIVAVPLMAMVVPPKISVGVILPIFMVADVLSLCYWYRYALLRFCFPYLIFIWIGIVGASFIMTAVDDKTFGVIIGWLILFLLALGFFTEKFRKNGKDNDLSSSPVKPSLQVSAFIGVLTGVVSALANASGPLVTLYVMMSRMDKFHFIGTVSVCAFFINWAKVPVFLSAGRLSIDTLKLSIAAIPMVVVGTFMGYKLAKIIPQKAFKNVILALAFVSALNLIFQ